MKVCDIDNDLQNGIERLLDEHYTLGKITHIEQILGGYCNKIYAVWAEKEGEQKKYVLRQSNPNLTEDEIRFEHALIRHLRNKDFNLVADVINGKDGGTFVCRNDVDAACGCYWAIFQFLTGEDRYSWTQTDLTDAEFESSAEILARLHHAGRDFQKPPDADRAQPPIMEFLATFPETFRGYAQKAKQCKSDLLFLDHLDRVVSAVDACLAINPQLKGFLQVPVHCDYHPGNLKFQGSKGIGLFDFDWSKVDYRLFDVALALVYFVSIWRGEKQGSLRLDKFEFFLKTYHQNCRKLADLDPLTAEEQNMMVPMLAAANLYVLNWDLMDFYTVDDPDDDEYYTYIDHNLRLMYWIEENREAIDQAVQKACHNPKRVATKSQRH